MRLLITLAVLSYAFTSAQAQIFVKHDAAGTDDGTSWENAYSSLQDALEHSTAGDQLWIAAGTYIPQGPAPDSSHFVVDKAVELYGGFAGTEGALEERDWKVNPTILSGDINGDDTPGDFEMNREDNAHHIVHIIQDDGLVIVDGITLKGGTTKFEGEDPDSPNREEYNIFQGGAMLIQGQVVVRNCTFRDNNGLWGSAITAFSDGTQTDELIIEDCLFDSNKAWFGAIRIDGMNNPVVRECTFQNNHVSGQGAAMFIINTNLTVDHCHFSMNSSDHSAGAIIIGHNPTNLIEQPSITIRGSIFDHNIAENRAGGVEFVNFYPGAELIIDSCQFFQNVGFEAGAIRVRSLPSANGGTSPKTTLRITETEFIENTGGIAGGILCWSTKDSLTVDIANTRFTNNEAELLGGGLYVFYQDSSTAHVRLNQVDFEGNVASIAGGLYFRNSNVNRLNFEIDSCLFKNNVATDYAGAFLSNESNGSILNSEFIDNVGVSYAGAIDSGGDSMVIENSLFSGNFTEGEGGGGGANWFWDLGMVTVKNTIFDANISLTNGSAAMITHSTKVRFENVLCNNNTGLSNLLNTANLSLANVTMIDNEAGLLQLGDAYTEIQNTILSNQDFNYIGSGNDTILSKGGNISSDGTLTDLLTGYGDYEDFHETDPELVNFVPERDGPCWDNGNPEGITTELDLAGLPRIMNVEIDIGAYEGLTVSAEEIKWNTSTLNVFPNPVQQILQFQIEDDWTGVLNISIYDLLGRKVHKSKQSKISGVQLFQENVSHLTSGEYVLLVSSIENNYASKIIVLNK